MKTEQARIISNRLIAKDTWRMILETTIATEVKPGQFVEVQVPGFFLRRPISVSEVLSENELALIYKVVGQGTACMSGYEEGQTLNLFGPLGNGFSIVDKDPVLIGGGVGVPPLVEAAKQFLNNDRKVTVVLGFNDRESVICVERFEELGCKVHIATMDGSLGTKGTVMDAMASAGITPDYVVSCGPLPMLKAVDQAASEGEISLEARMACGMGACMGCVVKDHEGNSWRVCKDGPVFTVGKVAL